MKTALLGLVVLLLGVRPAPAGSIVGSVRAQGKADADMTAGGKYDSKKFKFAPRVDYSSMRDFVIYVDQPLAEKFAPPAAPVQIVVQKDAVFVPHVLPILVGTTVAWPNQDDIFHNVFSISDPKPFDLGLYKEEVKQLVFDKPGKVDVFCSIHSEMHCTILVLENPYYGTSDARGRYLIPDVPAGTYTVRAWHERLPSQVMTVVVPATGEVEADFVLGITGLPEY